MKENNNLVHVFGVPEMKKCTQEENRLFFDKDFDINSLFKENYNNTDISESSYKDIKSILKNFKVKKYINAKASLMTALTLFISSNPQYTFAMTEGNNINLLEELPKKLGADLINSVTGIVITGIIIVTALRLLSEYSRGGSKHKANEITKECILALFIVIVLPTLPTLVKLFVNRYLQF